MQQLSNQETAYQVWKTTEVSQTFLTGVRGAIPLASEQIDVILRLIKLTQSQVNSFLDLGCGNGILGKAIYHLFPQGKGYFVDLSETMIEAAKDNIKSEFSQSQFILSDFSQSDWHQPLQQQTFDVIVSGFAIHHQPDSRKKEIYQEIYQLLNNGGIFLNLEHIASQSLLGEQAFDQLFVDSLYAFHQQQDSQQTREEIDQQYYNRSDKTANILAPVELQCQWLREIGFRDVDCFMKIFEIALFGGVKSVIC
ncbi:MAG: class I SAM-dependent methyltransferase [Microcystaceae cyanobacterium]